MAHQAMCSICVIGKGLGHDRGCAPFTVNLEDTPWQVLYNTYFTFGPGAKDELSAAICHYSMTCIV